VKPSIAVSMSGGKQFSFTAFASLSIQTVNDCYANNFNTKSVQANDCYAKNFNKKISKS